MNRKHLKCTLWKLLWTLGVLSLIAAWVSSQSDPVLEFEWSFWFWNALVFGVLAVPIKLDCHSCDVCGIGK
ncbi:MAG TPA: hypothetical protein VI981_01050 [Candidatus Paceibacterota bacterium]